MEYEWCLRILIFIDGSVRIMRRHLFLATLIGFTVLPSAFADSSVYSWRDKNGTMTFSDNPALAPKNATVALRSYITPAHSDDAQLAAPVMQREFARQLAIELGLGDNLTAEQAAAALAKVGIAPRLGRWNLDEPMTASLAERLRTLTAGAAIAGKIALDPERAVVAFDSTSALVGIRIRGVAAPQTTQPEPVAAEPEPQPVYVAPAPQQVVYDRVIYVGGGVDPFFTGTVPVIVNQRIVNVGKVVVRPDRPKPRMQPRTVHGVPAPGAKARIPGLVQVMPVANPGATGAGAEPSQDGSVAQYRVVPGRMVVRHMRPNFSGAVLPGGPVSVSGASPISAGGGYRLR